MYMVIPRYPPSFSHIPLQLPLPNTHGSPIPLPHCLQYFLRCHVSFSLHLLAFPQWTPQHLRVIQTHHHICHPSLPSRNTWVSYITSHSFINRTFDIPISNWDTRCLPLPKLQGYTRTISFIPSQQLQLSWVMPSSPLDYPFTWPQTSSMVTVMQHFHFIHIVPINFDSTPGISLFKFWDIPNLAWPNL